jgi:hypothetical protein
VFKSVKDLNINIVPSSTTETTALSSVRLDRVRRGDPHEGQSSNNSDARQVVTDRDASHLEAKVGS